MTIQDSLRDAAACGRLVFVTGAGISTGMRRLDGSPLPKWGALVQQLRDHRTIRDAQFDAILDDLLPVGSLDQLHGDALIEASEIISRGYERDKFSERLIELCREVPGTHTETHRAIAEAQPAGIITFNYDCGHESAYQALGMRKPDKLIYSDDSGLRACLGKIDQRNSFLLKAHGCVDVPNSAVLTSSSYRSILANFRTYRAFLHNVLITYSIIIVGFAMRDRDFDQLMLTLEVELGGPVQHLAVLTKEPDRDPAGEIARASWATLKARFGVEPIFVGDYPEIPEEIRKISSKPGPLIEELARNAVSTDKRARMVAHDRAKGLGSVGRVQLRSKLFEIISNSHVSLEAKSEAIYTIGLVGEGTFAVAEALMQFIESVAGIPVFSLDIGHAECVAHALLVLRATRVDDIGLSTILRRMHALSVQQCFVNLDEIIVNSGGNVRIVVYAAAAAAEIAARTAS